MLHNADSHLCQDEWNRIPKCSQNLGSFRLKDGVLVQNWLQRKLSPSDGGGGC